MISIEPLIESPQEIHEDQLWVRSECYRFYVEKRRENCTFMQLLDLWLLAPYCTDCALSDPFGRYKDPDIIPSTWELDILCEIGPLVLEDAKSAIRLDGDHFFICKKCGRELRPWGEDDIYIFSYHLEEHYGIPLETPRRKKPSKKLQNGIISLYGKRCFGCDDGKTELHIDHILPRSKGGDAAFRNLQPLCKKCGSGKRDQVPEEIEVHSTMYFSQYPSDTYEGLFW